MIANVNSLCFVNFSFLQYDENSDALPCFWEIMVKGKSLGILDSLFNRLVVCKIANFLGFIYTANFLAMEMTILLWEGDMTCVICIGKWQQGMSLGLRVY